MFSRRKKDKENEESKESLDKTIQDTEESSTVSASQDSPDEENGDKALKVYIREKNTVEVDFSGEIVIDEDGEPKGSEGVIKVQNTGTTNRITGVNLYLDNLDGIESREELSETNMIGVLAPGRDNDFVRNYSYEAEIDPIKIEQDYYDPQTGLSPNFLGATEKDFEIKITITNTSDETIYEITGEKELNKLASVNDSEISSGEISTEGSTVTFDIDSIESGDSIEIILKLSATLPDDVPTYVAGDLKVTYQHRDMLSSGLSYQSVDGVSDFKRRIRRRQREKEPGFYDCEIFLENKSEFTYDLTKFSVFAGNLESQQIIFDWDGAQASEEDRQLLSNGSLSFEYVFESLEGTPSFGDQIEFSVYTEENIASETEVFMAGQELKFMAIDITKSFLDMNDQPIDRYEIPSYIETSIPTVVTLTGVGTYPLEGLVIADEIPDSFRVHEIDEVIIMRNGEELSDDLYDVSLGNYSSGDEDNDDMQTDDSECLIVNLHHLEESEEGGFDVEQTITVRYVVIADQLQPSDDPIRVQAHGEGFVYEDETSRVYAHSDPESLNLVVLHQRDDVDISKFISARDHNGKDAYRIELEAENFGSSTVIMEIQDLIPEGFELVEESIETEPAEDVEYQDPSPTDGGRVHGWIFQNVAPESRVTAAFMLVESSKIANPRELQSVYKG